MLIDVDRLPQEGLEISQEYEVFSSDLVEANVVFLHPVHVEISVKKIGEEISIKGRIKTCLSFICSRCLVPFEFSVDSCFDLIYLPEELEDIKEQLEKDDLNKSFYYCRKLDIREVVLEQLNLTFPLKPLCSEDCQGICPVCMKIVKDGDCSCATNESDPRLVKLKTFLRDKR